MVYIIVPIELGLLQWLWLESSYRWRVWNSVHDKLQLYQLQHRQQMFGQQPNELLHQRGRGTDEGHHATKRRDQGQVVEQYRMQSLGQNARLWGCRE